jgi:hypothetical protein
MILFSELATVYGRGLRGLWSRQEQLGNGSGKWRVAGSETMNGGGRSDEEDMEILRMERAK